LIFNKAFFIFRLGLLVDLDQFIEIIVHFLFKVLEFTGLIINMDLEFLIYLVQYLVLVLLLLH